MTLRDEIAFLVGRMKLDQEECPDPAPCAQCKVRRRLILELEEILAAHANE